MVKLILIISVVLFSSVCSYEFEAVSSALYEGFDVRKIVTELIHNNDTSVQISSEWFDTLSKYVNHYQDYTDKIASMILLSGRDLNDLGRYINCNSLNYTRYISAAVIGLPIGIYFGIWGPIECTQEDYYPLKGKLVAAANYISDMIPDVATLKVNWTEDNFLFVDSKAKNAENTEISIGFIVSVSFFGFFILCWILGTIFELRLESFKRQATKTFDEFDENSTSLSIGDRNSQKDIEVKPRGAIQNFLYSFALFNNTRRLIYGRGENPDKELEILNGIRVFSLTFVIIGHTYKIH